MKAKAEGGDTSHAVDRGRQPAIKNLGGQGALLGLYTEGGDSGDSTGAATTRTKGNVARGDHGDIRFIATFFLFSTAIFTVGLKMEKTEPI